MWRGVAQHPRQTDRGERHPRALLAHPRGERVARRHTINDVRRHAIQQLLDECGTLAVRQVSELRIAQRAIDEAELSFASVVPHAVDHHPPRQGQPECARDHEARSEQRLDLDFGKRVHHATRTGWRGATGARWAERSWRATNDRITESTISSMSVVGANPTRFRSFEVSGTRRGMSS